MQRLLTIFVLSALLAACSSAPEYPGVKTNVNVGNIPRQTNFPMAKNYTPAPAGEGLVKTVEKPSGDKSICVGAWCSCDSH